MKEVLNPEPTGSGKSPEPTIYNNRVAEIDRILSVHLHRSNFDLVMIGCDQNGMKKRRVSKTPQKPVRAPAGPIKISSHIDEILGDKN